MVRQAPHRKRRGASLVEYVSVMAIGAALLAGGAVFLGRATKDTFNLADRAFTPGKPGENAAQEVAESAPEVADDGLMSPWVACGLLAAGAIGLACVHFAKKKAPPVVPEREPIEEPLPQVPEHVEAHFIAKRQQILQILDRELWCVFDGRILVQDILTDRPTTVKPDTTVERVGQVLDEEQVRHALVVDMQGKLLGVISDRDVAARKGKTAAEIMTRNPEVVPKGMPVASAISLMLARRISSLPVVEDGKIVGVVTSNDMLMTLQCCIQLLQRLAGTMWQPGMGATPSWDGAASTTEAASGDATGRLFDVMKAMSESQQ
jgi:predicted transcriptional regulator